MSVVISFGDWPDAQIEHADGSGVLIRQGFRIGWAKPVEKHILFSLTFQIRISDIEVEHKFIMRAF